MNVLIVEDERRMAEQLRRGLEREGYSVVVANDGQQALDLVRTLDHDIIVLDWMLPKLDGRGVLQRLRSAKVKTPVLMLTARDASTDVIEGLDCGADDYLTKPFSFEVLLARLRALARRGPAPKLPTLEIADLVLDPATHRVYRGDAEIRLSKREFTLLHSLMHRANQVVQRETLIESVWGYGAQIESNTLDAFIHLLRRKIDGDGRVRLIHTVRGIGYCFSETPR